MITHVDIYLGMLPDLAYVIAVFNYFSLIQEVFAEDKL